MLNPLDHALSIAVKAHTGQKDKGGEAYILHPLRLMMKFESEELKIIAVLHDVVEDSSITIDDLKQYGFNQNILNAIHCLSKREHEKYEDFILRIKSNSLASKVKIEDIKDNINVLRIPTLSDIDLSRVKKYHHALKVLVKNR